MYIYLGSLQVFSSGLSIPDSFICAVRPLQSTNLKHVKHHEICPVLLFKHHSTLLDSGSEKFQKVPRPPQRNTISVYLVEVSL